MSAAEFALWLAFYQERGFDVDRLEFVAAQAGTAAAAAGGLKVRPLDLVMPAAPENKRRRVFDWLNSLERAKHVS